MPRDDFDLQGPRENRTEFIGLRAPVAFYKKIKRAAKNLGLTVSDYMRLAVRSYIEKDFIKEQMQKKKQKQKLVKRKKHS